MTDRPYLSVCIIVRDAEKTIEALLRSIAGNFDEYVFVDTGSVDKTLDVIGGWLSEGTGKPTEGDVWCPGPGQVREYVLASGATVKLSFFKWVDDFAAARNFAYSLSNAKWKCYLDADDTFEDSKVLKDQIEKAEKRNPQINAIAIPYEYAKNDTEQDVLYRVTKHDENNVWTWEDEVHEHLVTMNGMRIVSKFEFMKVVHHRDHSDSASSFIRNRRIAQKVFDDPKVNGEKRARFAYHLAQSEKFFGEYDKALEHLSVVIDVLGDGNIGAYAYNDFVRILIEKGDLDNALRVAGEMSARLPEHREADMLAAIIHAHKENWGRAATLFDQGFMKNEIDLQSYVDVWFMKGYVPSMAAKVYLKVGRFEDAKKMISSVPPALALNPDVQPVFSRVHAEVMKRIGQERFQALFDYLLWDTEPMKALSLLRLAPAAISSNANIARMGRKLAEKMRHLQGWENYKEAYASIPDDTYHTSSHDRENTLKLWRAQVIMDWARALPKDGDPIEMCSIGFQDGIIEREVMRANPRIVLTVADAAPQASQGFTMLEGEFGETRVKRHLMRDDHYDWCPPGAFYDVVVMFEVLEHLPSDRTALITIRDMLKEDGEMFLSTPVASRWVEPHLTDDKFAPEWFGHVRAHNHVTLWDQLRDAGFDGLLTEGYDGVFVAHMKKRPDTFAGKVSIMVPGRPEPFDPFSHMRGHVGGSEECVIHLAAGMAKEGWDVTVFTPEPDHYPIVRGYNGVIWRPQDEFDEMDSSHENVLFWRSAAMMPKDAPYKKLLWLHDAYYGVPASEYEKADDVLVLSKTHAESIKNHDGYQGPFVQVANGIAEESFWSLIGDERDPHKFIYASSPDRGLARLLALWPKIREAEPNATLDIFYDWTNYKKMFPIEHAEMTNLVASLANDGVIYHGGVDHGTLHSAFRRAAIWAYPNSGEVETFCITAVKAMACGCTPIVSNVGSLHEVTDQWSVKPEVDDSNIDTAEGMKVFLDAILDVMRNPWEPEKRDAMRFDTLMRFGWEPVTKMFLDRLD